MRTEKWGVKDKKLEVRTEKWGLKDKKLEVRTEKWRVKDKKLEVRTEEFNWNIMHYGFNFSYTDTYDVLESYCRLNGCNNCECKL